MDCDDLIWRLQRARFNYDSTVYQLVKLIRYNILMIPGQHLHNCTIGLTVKGIFFNDKVCFIIFAILCCIYQSYFCYLLKNEKNNECIPEMGRKNKLINAIASIYNNNK